MCMIRISGVCHGEKKRPCRFKLFCLERMRLNKHLRLQRALVIEREGQTRMLGVCV